MGLAGKVVFITGAARGVGAAVAREAASRGAHVALAGLEPAELAARTAELGSGHAHFECDVTDMESIEAAVAGTLEVFGRIDIVLANAGIGIYGTIEKGDPDVWLKAIDVNLGGVFRTVHATLPALLDSRGYIAIVSSTSAFAPLAGMSAYTASKAGVEAMTRALRQEVGFRGVAAGAVHPSWIDTDMVRDTAADLASFREMRERLPWPARSTTSVEKCARAIVEGFEKRSARVFVPRSTALLYWLRSLINSGAAERATASEAATMIPRMEAEVAELGRQTSSRTGQINRLENDETASEALAEGSG